MLERAEGLRVKVFSAESGWRLLRPAVGGRRTLMERGISETGEVGGDTDGLGSVFACFGVRSSESLRVLVTCLQKPAI